VGLLDRLFLPVAKHFIAGASLEDAMTVAKEMNGRGFKVIVNFLGEEIRDEKELGATMAEYLSIFDQMEANRVDGCVSVKPTQLGLTMDPGRAASNLHVIVERAKRSGTYLWVDMEGTEYTEQTIQLYLRERKDYDRMGVAIQAYLRRTSADIDHLVKEGGQVRLCKGAYNEPASLAFKDREEVQRNYLEMLKKLFSQPNFFAVATHDDKLQDEAKRLAGGPGGNFEFEMLRGIREELGRKLLSEGYGLSVYLPYGANWMAYSLRRMKERKRNILLLFRALFS
jgi:proline dehydrogenase